MTIEGVEPRVQVIDVAALFVAHHLPLVHLAVLLVDDLATAEDVVQDAFLGLYRNADRLRDPFSALGYLRQSTVNGARSTLRRRRTVRSYLRVSEPQSTGPADEQTLLADEHERVLAAVRTLPRRDREVLALRYWSDLDEEEIASALRMSRGTVKSTASRAIAKLEKILEGAR